MTGEARGLGPVIGHEEVRGSLAVAVASRALPATLLFHGPPGVGKQRVALWLAQLLTCRAPGPDGFPCDTCEACRLGLRLQHPDVHWFFPLPRPKVSGGSDRLADALEEARASELAQRRARPYQPTLTGEPAGIYLAHVQVLRRIAAARPAAGMRKVFIVGDAEQLVPQEASPEAANALLKVLEEPPPDTFVILTAADPEALLPTLRSRALPVRLRALPESLVVEFLTRVAGADAGAARTAARLGQGSIGRALAFLPGEDGPGPLEELRSAARGLLDAAMGSAADRFIAAQRQSASGARGATFAGTLEHLTLWLRDLGATAAGAPELVVNADAHDWLLATAQRLPRGAHGIPAAVRAVDAAAQLAHFNVNPQLTLNWLLRTLRRSLAPGS